MCKTSLTTCFIVVMLVAAAIPMAAETDRQGPPRLIVQITVDQLRGDLPTRYRDRLGEGGFRYLLENGIHYANAHYQHATTETIVGHATLATGAHPAAHGMVANVWYDRELGRLVYNIEDSRYKLLTAGADVDSSTEIDPTQKKARSEGRSPAAILVSTFSDELAILTAGRAKVFAVSVKDRGAVSMAGHAGKAYWFSKASGEFVTSTYYQEQYPEWVETWNAQRHTDRYAGKSWELLHDQESYLFGNADDQEWETALPGFGRTFPHAWGAKDGKYYTTLLTISPAADELTLDFALELLENEELGADDIPDFLGISFSATDYVGHLFGPSSLEAEDNLLRLDRTLARLFKALDDKVGLENTLVVLSADHGAPEAPGSLTALGIETAYVKPGTWDKAPAIEALKRRFGVGESLIEAYYQPYVYLNRKIIAELGLDQAKVERAVADELMKLDGVALALSSEALRDGAYPEMPLVRKVLNNFNPKRSGDIFIVFEPQRFVADFDGLTVASAHGSPWSYDTFVPIFVAGAGVAPSKVLRRVAPNDIAPTLSAIVGAKPPSGSAGDLLIEVFETRN